MCLWMKSNNGISKSRRCSLAPGPIFSPPKEPRREQENQKNTFSPAEIQSYARYVQIYHLQFSNYRMGQSPVG